MTKVQNLTMTALATVALVAGILLATGAISFAQEGSPTPTPSAESTDGATPTPAPSDDGSTDSDDSADAGRGCGGSKGLVLENAAEVLGLSEDDLRAALEDGQTLAEVAADHGMSADDFKAALSAGVTADLQAKIDAGEITQERFDETIADLDAKLDEIINREGGLRFHGPRGFGDGARFQSPADSADMGTDA